MLHCIVIGDSLAVGVGKFQPDCQTTAKVGITSDQYIDRLLDGVERVADRAVISLGVNDDTAAATLDNLRTVRARLEVQTAYWLLPARHPAVRAAIRRVADEYGDRVVDTSPQAGADHLHPSGQGYKLIADRIEQTDADPEQ